MISSFQIVTAHRNALESDIVRSGAIGDTPGTLKVVFCSSAVLGYHRGHISLSLCASRIQPLDQMGVEEGYHVPCDDKEQQVDAHGHKTMFNLDVERLFRSPFSQKSMPILDFGSGSSWWAYEVAVQCHFECMFPAVPTTSHGTDLFVIDWVYAVDQFFPISSSLSRPTNCIAQEEDLLQASPCGCRYDLVHIRNLAGSFTDKDWNSAYQTRTSDLIFLIIVKFLHWYFTATLCLAVG